MKKLCTIITLFIAVVGFSQTAIKKSSISSGGTSTTVGTLAMVYTIGEVAISEKTNGTIHISEGFISSKTLATLGIKNYTTLGKISMYPNPATNFVNINFTEQGNYSISVFNTAGKQLFTQKTSNIKQQINLEPYASGVYLLLIKNTEKQVYKTYKLVKK